MEGLVLRPGGRLEYLRWENGPEADGIQATDVTAEAMEYLFEPVTLDPGIRLLDLFLLLRRDPLFLRIYRQEHLADYLAEAFGLQPATAETAPSAEIEFLELVDVWPVEKATGEIQALLHRPDLRGVGRAAGEDVIEDGCVVLPRGARRLYALDFLPLKRLLGLPLRINEQVFLTEAPFGDEAPGTPAVYRYGRHTLGEIMHAVLWELSFYGDPAQRDDKARWLAGLLAGEKPEGVPLPLGPAPVDGNRDGAG